MYLINDKRTGKVYKTKFDITKDVVSFLFHRPFVTAGVLTEQEARIGNTQSCMERFPYFKILGWYDGRSRQVKQVKEWFSWLLVIDGVDNKD